ARLRGPEAERLHRAADVDTARRLHGAVRAVGGPDGGRRGIDGLPLLSGRQAGRAHPVPRPAREARRDPPPARRSGVLELPARRTERLGAPPRLRGGARGRTRAHAGELVLLSPLPAEQRLLRAAAAVLSPLPPEPDQGVPLRGSDDAAARDARRDVPVPRGEPDVPARRVGPTRRLTRASIARDRRVAAKPPREIGRARRPAPGRAPPDGACGDPSLERRPPAAPRPRAPP